MQKRISIRRKKTIKMDKKRVTLLSSLVFGVLCLVFLVISIFIRNNKTTELSPLQYVLASNPMLPEEPGYFAEYMYFRIPSDIWTQEQIDEWFIRPEGENLEQLKAANEQVVRKILEVAP